MTSKKIAATLGTGAIGASGAAGAVALNFGLAGEKNLEVDPSNPAPNTKEPPGDHTASPETKTNENQRREPGSQGKQTTTMKSPFDGASGYEIKAFNSKNWKTVEGKKKDGMTIKVEEEGDTWECTVRGAIFNDLESKKQSINAQIEEFVKKIKENENKRKKFMENCSKARLTNEKNSGKESTIELEMEENTGKLKGLDDLLEREFLGLKRVEEEYQGVLGFKEGVIAFVPEKKEDNKLSLNIKVGNLSCSIFGKIEDTDFKKNNFSFDSLSKIFMSDSDRDARGNVNNAYTKEEKKKFLIRNCLDNNGAIEGLKIVSYIHKFTEKSSMKKWKFENLEELLLTKMYKNPENQQSQKSALSPAE